MFYSTIKYGCHFYIPLNLLECLPVLTLSSSKFEIFLWVEYLNYIYIIVFCTEDIER